jgi:aryl-alcohol dehydrogenase-like predicted oxidoreductase
LLEEFRKRDCVRRIGASVYSPYEAEDLLEAYPLDVVQLPLNVFDQRAVEGGTLQRLAQVGVAVHARSLLLQGLLLMDPGTVPVGMGRFIPRLRRWHEACASAGSSPLAAALSFAAEQPIEGLVVGVQSRAQLVECLAALERQVQLKWSSFSSADADLIDPRKWSV